MRLRVHSLNKGVFWQSGLEKNRFFVRFFSQENHDTFWYAVFRTQIYSYLESNYNFFFNEINKSCGNYIILGKACF